MNTAAKSNYPPTYDNGKPRKTVGQIVSYIVLVLWAFISVFPVYWMLTFSLKTNEEIFGENVIGLPKYWVWENYTRAMNTGNMPLYFLNSVIVAVSTIIITLLASVMATYAITRLDWKGRKSMNKFFMLGLTIPIHASIVPLYTTLAKLKMLNSYFALILPYSAF
ncbi:MAG: carbohydrate ABC transporter permease, partial [Clostridia bacterium]|nr:carbohydrate ABC transporter permease [Clostridia bacterium]